MRTLVEVRYIFAVEIHLTEYLTVVHIEREWTRGVVKQDRKTTRKWF